MKRKIAALFLTAVAPLFMILTATPAGATIPPWLRWQTSGWAPTSGGWGTVVTVQVTTNASYVCAFNEGTDMPFPAKQSCTAVGGRLTRIPTPNMPVAVHIRVTKFIGYHQSPIMLTLMAYNPAKTPGWIFGETHFFAVTTRPHLALGDSHSADEGALR